MSWEELHVPSISGWYWSDFWQSKWIDNLLSFNVVVYALKSQQLPTACSLIVQLTKKLLEQLPPPPCYMLKMNIEFINLTYIIYHKVSMWYVILYNVIMWMLQKNKLGFKCNGSNFIFVYTSSLRYIFWTIHNFQEKINLCSCNKYNH